MNREKYNERAGVFLHEKYNLVNKTLGTIARQHRVEEWEALTQTDKDMFILLAEILNVNPKEK